jgi:hypothetical protein
MMIMYISYWRFTLCLCKSRPFLLNSLMMRITVFVLPLLFLLSAV